VDDTGQTWLAELDADGEEARMLRPLPAAAITYRMTFGPRAGQKVLHDARPARRARSTTCRLRAPRAARTQPAGRYGLHHPQGLSAGRGYSGSLHGVALGPARRKPQAVGVHVADDLAVVLDFVLEQIERERLLAVGQAVEVQVGKVLARAGQSRSPGPYSLSAGTAAGCTGATSAAALSSALSSACSSPYSVSNDSACKPCSRSQRTITGT